MADDEEQNIENVKETGEKSDAEYEREIKDRESRAQQALNSGNIAQALEVALNDPPLLSKNQSLKDRNSAIVVNVLVNTKEKDVDAVVQKLNEVQLDICMKYIYKGLESGENSNILLKWHESVFNRGGLGTIVRTLAERRAV